MGVRPGLGAGVSWLEWEWGLALLEHILGCLRGRSVTANPSRRHWKAYRKC